MADYPYPELIGLDTTPEELDTLRDLKAVDENLYYSGVANVLNNMILSNYAANQSGRNEGLFQKLEDLKGKSEPAYYKAQLRYLGEQLGWQHGQNTYDNTGPVQQQIQALIPEAQKAGLSADEINDVLGGSFATASGINQQGIATRAATGGSGFNFQKDMLPGLKFVGGAALAMTGAGAALAPGAGAAGAGAGAGAIDSTAVALGGSGGGGAFIPAAGSGASFGIVPGAAYTTAGLGTSSNLGLMGPTYGELGITGVEGGYAGPTYGEMGYTGLNQGEAIAAADAASKGLTGADALNYINNAKKAYETANSLSKILNPTNATGATNATNATNATGYNPQQLASLLSQPLPTQAAPGKLYRMNENPFNFGTQGQTVALPGTYDVSGTNPMANTLRNYKA